MSDSLAWIALVTFACGVPHGLLLRSASEIRAGSREPRLFVAQGVLGTIALIVEKGVVATALVFAPSLGLLTLLGEVPHASPEWRVWLLANLAGIGLGRWIRWMRWRRTQDFR